MSLGWRYQIGLDNPSISVESIPIVEAIGEDGCRAEGWLLGTGWDGGSTANIGPFLGLTKITVRMAREIL